MSKANNAVKVLRTALKRVQKGWTKSEWHFHGSDGKNYVCLEGAIYGYCNAEKHPVTDAQREAIAVVKSVIRDRTDGKMDQIPAFNDDPETELEDIMEVIKLGIIRLESGWDEDGMDDEEFDELLTYKEASQS